MVIPNSQSVDSWKYIYLESKKTNYPHLENRQFFNTTRIAVISFPRQFAYILVIVSIINGVGLVARLWCGCLAIPLNGWVNKFPRFFIINLFIGNRREHKALNFNEKTHLSTIYRCLFLFCLCSIEFTRI